MNNWEAKVSLRALPGPSKSSPSERLAQEQSNDGASLNSVFSALRKQPMYYLRVLRGS